MSGAPTPPQPLSAPTTNNNTVILDQAIKAFQNIGRINGQAYLVGEIVQQGQTNNPVNVDITDPRDRETITAGVPFMVDMKVVSGEPSEPHIDVTPGSTPVQKGELPAFEEAQ